MPLAAGTRVGAYEVVSAIGAGGMGEVYRARDHRLGRDVALKILPQAFAQNPDRLARFEREAKTLAALNHPNIAAIYGIEESAGLRALVMELVPGRTLDDVIRTAFDARRSKFDVNEPMSIARSIAEALEAAHDAGVIHRDLKPANVKVRDDGVVKVLDFGLAKSADAFGSSQPERGNVDVTRDDGGRSDPRHGRIHVARAGAREAGGQTRRRLGVRRRALRAAERQAAL